jgi:hypothetical protein
MASNTAQINVGRLLEIRADAGYRTAEEVDELFSAVGAEVRRAGIAKAVTVVDWRKCPIMAPIAAARMTERMTGVNARTERSAALALADSSIAVLQFLRVIREAGLPHRKLFFAPAPLVDWLGEVLTAEESTRLREFIGD